MDRQTVRHQLADASMTLTVELGRVSMPAAGRLRAGDVIRLDKLAGEAMDIRVNGALLGQGEITATGAGMERRGVRIIHMAADEAGT